MDTSDRLPPGLRHGIDQTVAAQRLEGWRPTDHHLATLVELLSGERTFADYLAEHCALYPPPVPRRRTLRRKRPYLIPGTTILLNSFGTDSPQVLAELEFVATAGRTAQWHERDCGHITPSGRGHGRGPFTNCRQPQPAWVL